MLRNMLLVLGTIFSGYVLLCLLVVLFQSRLVYFPEKTISQTPRSYHLPYEDVQLVTRDAVKLHGWYIPSQSAVHTVLFCHGNAGNISHRLESIRIFNALGLNVFIFDYRGFGQSEGSIGEQGSYLDTQAAWDYLTGQKNTRADQIILFGRSLGGALAAQLASHKAAAAVIIESGFISIPVLGQQLYPFLPVKYLSRINYPTIEYLSKNTIPKLIIHSRDDELIPFAHGMSIYEHVPGPKTFLELKGSHNDGFLVSGPVYLNGLRKFIASLPDVKTGG